MKMLRLALLGFATFVLQVTGLSEDSSTPNIVFIMADDMGWTDPGCFNPGAEKYYETPNIDKLCFQGAKFTNYYTNQNCATTRAALISGQYSPRTHVFTAEGPLGQPSWLKMIQVENIKKSLPEKMVTLAEPLKKKGYATAMLGKWHAGAAPAKQGFDEVIETKKQAHFDFVTEPENHEPKGTYLGDWLTDKSIDFIKRKKDGPFFLYLSHFLVHEPFEGKKELIEKYKNKKGVGGHNNPIYAAMVENLDQNVGRVLMKLEELGLEKNTVVIFCSDNGGLRNAYNGLAHVTSNDPLRAEKGHLYEGGIRTPFIIRWPGVVQAGTVFEEPIHCVDIYPTFVEITGSEKPANHSLDGVSLVSYLKSGGRESLNRDLFWHLPGYVRFWHITPQGAIRSGDFKMIEFFEDGRRELYNLKDDIGEKNNLAESNPEKLEELTRKLHAWQKEINAPMPTENPKYDEQKVKEWYSARHPENPEGKPKGKNKGKKKKG